MKHLSPEEKAAMLVTYFKQGWNTLKKNYDARVLREKEKTDMRPGEGAIMFNNMPAIQNILK